MVIKLTWFLVTKTWNMIHKQTDADNSISNTQTHARMNNTPLSLRKTAAGHCCCPSSSSWWCQAHRVAWEQSTGAARSEASAPKKRPWSSAQHWAATTAALRLSRTHRHHHHHQHLQQGASAKGYHSRPNQPHPSDSSEGDQPITWVSTLLKFVLSPDSEREVMLQRTVIPTRWCLSVPVERACKAQRLVSLLADAPELLLTLICLVFSMSFFLWFFLR